MNTGENKIGKIKLTLLSLHNIIIYRERKILAAIFLNYFHCNFRAQIAQIIANYIIAVKCGIQNQEILT